MKRFTRPVRNTDERNVANGQAQSGGVVRHTLETTCLSFRLVRQNLSSREARQVALMMFLATVVLWGQIEHEVFYSVDGASYAVVGKELLQRPFIEWVQLTQHSAPFYEHPHLTPWLLGLSMKIFGVGTTTAIMPIIFISTLTVLLTYGIGYQLIDHRFGLLAATTLVLTPQFIKGGRNPMLEPALMFFIMLTVYCHIRATRSTKQYYTILMGLALGLAFLAKGPPAALALAVILAFQGIALLFPKYFEHFPFNVDGLVRVFWAVVIAVGVVSMVDLWHYVMAGHSFLAHYVSHQLQFTIAESRGKLSNDLSFYARIFFRYWPWLPFILLSIPLVIWKTDRVAVPALVLNSLITFGTFLGFTFMKHKAFWYVAIHYAGSSLMAALTLRYLLSEHFVQRHYSRWCLIVAISILFLSATFPSLFLRYTRPTERFLQKAAFELGNQLDEKAVADCIPMEAWRGPFLLKFYLGVVKAECADSKAKFRMIDHRNHVFDHRSYRILFSQHPFSIVEVIPD